jgi:hypothetical protein
VVKLTKDDTIRYTNAGLLQAKKDYELLLSTYDSKRYYNLTLERITAEYSMILEELEVRKISHNLVNDIQSKLRKII